MSKVKNVFLDNDGDAIDLNSISAIYRTETDESGVYFKMRYDNGEEIKLLFLFEEHVEEKEILFNKINSIRLDIIKQWNNGEEGKSYFNKIDLKKSNKAEVNA